MKKTASKSEDVDMCSIEIKKTNLVHELEKIDINEELVRFSSHIKNITDIINSSVYPKGKKIDFILQELNREINTIAAKCPHVIISKIVIDIKSKLEKAREQSQNIV